MRQVNTWLSTKVASIPINVCLKLIKRHLNTSTAIWWLQDACRARWVMKFWTQIQKKWSDCWKFEAFFPVISQYFSHICDVEDMYLDNARNCFCHWNQSFFPSCFTICFTSFSFLWKAPCMGSKCRSCLARMSIYFVSFLSVVSFCTISFLALILYHYL